MRLCYLRLTTDLVLYLARTEKVHANYYSAQTEMLEIFSSINILSAKLLLTRHGDISAVLIKICNTSRASAHLEACLV